MALIPYETPSGTINGVNKTFTASTTIYQFDSVLVDGADYTTAPVISGSTFTLADAPTATLEIQFYDTVITETTTAGGNNTLVTNRGNVRTNLKIDPKKKIWSDDTLDRYINEGQRWLINDSAIDWEFSEAIGYLLPTLDYQEYRTSNDDNPETFFTKELRRFIKIQTNTGGYMDMSDIPNYSTGSSTSSTIVSTYAQRYFINAGYDAATTYTTLHNMDTFDGDGTWTASNDATGVATNTEIMKEGTGCVTFSVDVSNSDSNVATITNSDMTAVSLSDDIDKGGVIVWVYFPTTTYMKSVEVKFGSDSSNYYAVRQFNTDVQGINYQVGWNRVFLQARNKQTVGSPDLSAIDYLQVTIDFDSSQTDANSFAIDNIQFCDKYLQYWYTRKSKDLVTDSDESVVPNQYQYIFELYAQWKALSIIQGKEDKAKLFLDEARLSKNIMIEELQYNIPRTFAMPPYN